MLSGTTLCTGMSSIFCKFSNWLSLVTSQQSFGGLIQLILFSFKNAGVKPGSIAFCHMISISMGPFSNVIVGKNLDVSDSKWYLVAMGSSLYTNTIVDCDVPKL